MRETGCSRLRLNGAGKRTPPRGLKGPGEQAERCQVASPAESRGVPVNQARGWHEEWARAQVGRWQGWPRCEVQPEADPLACPQPVLTSAWKRRGGRMRDEHGVSTLCCEKGHVGYGYVEVGFPRRLV